MKSISNLLIKCPKCKAIVDTGVSMNLSVFCASKLANNAAICTEHTCKAKIAWDKEDVLAISFCQTE